MLRVQGALRATPQRRRGLDLSLKWEQVEDGLRSGDWSISPQNYGYKLKLGWNMVTRLDTVEGCKRVANCIQREHDKDGRRK